MAKIVGIEGMNPQQLANELQSGARFVQYQYCVSALVITFKRGTDIYFLRAGESPTLKGLEWTLLTLVAGWWGIPWGPIYTVQSLWVNLRGGHDLTPEAATALQLPIDKSALYPEVRKAAGAGDSDFNITHPLRPRAEVLITREMAGRKGWGTHGVVKDGNQQEGVEARIGLPAGRTALSRSRYITNSFDPRSCCSSASVTNKRLSSKDKLRRALC